MGGPPVFGGRRAPGLDSGHFSDPSVVQAESSGVAGRLFGLPKERCHSLLKAPCLDLPASGRLLAHRHSPRLAAKNRGVRKSSLLRAQNLMCKKLKMARFASKGDRPSSSPITLAPILVGVGPSSPPRPGSPLPPAPPTIPYSVDVSSRRSDLLTQLSIAE